MNEINISRFKAAQIVKKYYEEYYSNMVNIDVKPKLENNDLVILVKKKSRLNKKIISLTEKINEGKIIEIIKKYMQKRDCYIENIMIEPYFHNLNIRYNGEFNLEEKRNYFIKKKAR